METRIFKVDPEKFDPSVLAPAAKILRDGGIVGFPTETVYGLAVDLDRPESVTRLLSLRESPQEKHITVHVSSIDEAVRRASFPSCGRARRLVGRLWPGPLTVVVPSRDGQGVGVRLPNHRVAVELIKAAAVRVGAPSANLSGKPPATTGAEVVRQFQGKIEAIIDAGPSRHKLASTVVRATGPRLEVLREGAIPKAVIEELNVTTILFVCSGNTCRSPMASALFRRILARKAGVEDVDLESKGFRVLSAGTGAIAGGAPSDQAVDVLREMGVDLSGHRSQPATERLLEESDRVFAMTARHKQLLQEMKPECASHVELLDPEGEDIADPFGSNAAAYRTAAQRIRECLEKRLGEFR